MEKSVNNVAARALYSFQAQIPEELSFAKGDILAILREQEDGWWEAEVEGQYGRYGLVPNNYLQDAYQTASQRAFRFD